ncbi:MAG: tetratricopeptide repeat protein, partial [Planctomycetales bacterium]
MHLIRAVWAGKSVAWNKILLAATTAWIWSLCGARGTDPLIGVAMFEIFHAVQYLAIVWVTNQQWAARRSESRGLFSGLVQRPRLLLFAYLGLIAVYGGAHHLAAVGMPETLGQWSAWKTSAGLGWETGTGGTLAYLASILPMALLGTSTLLHYYFDGFIWKIRDQRLQQGLNLSEKESPAARWVPGLLHAAKWSFFAAPVLLLLTLEVTGRSADPRRQSERLQAVAAALTECSPNSSDARMFQAKIALANKDFAAAQAACLKTLALRKNDPEAHALQGNVFEEMGVRELAASSYRMALRHDPGNLEYERNLAGVLRDDRQWEEAERRYQDLARRSPSDATILHDLGTLHGLW